MRRAFLLLFIFLFLSFPAKSQVTANVFDIKVLLLDGDLKFFIKTDLPNDTEIKIVAARSYWEKGSSTEYSINYFSEKSTVQNLGKALRIPINNRQWKSKLKKKQEKLAGTDRGFNIEKISDSIKVSAVIPINQNNPKFGDENSKLSGEVVNTDGRRTIEKEVAVFYPHSGLSKDNIYVLSDKTALYLTMTRGQAMFSEERIIYLNRNNRVRILSKKWKEQLWYEVEAFKKNGEKIDQGWIYSGSLYNQKLKVQK